MQMRHRVGVAGIVGRLDGENVRVEIPPIGQLRLVEREINAGFDFAAEEIGGCADDVVARAARHEPGLHGFLGIVNVVHHLNSGQFFEAGDRVGTNEVGPVVNEQTLLFGRHRETGQQACRAQQCGQQPPVPGSARAHEGQ